MVFWILAPLFLAVGFYLLWYSRRRIRLVETFAKMHQLQIRPECKQELQKKLDTCFSLEDKGFVRSFGQLSSLVEGESIWLFRAVELIDLNPHAQSYTTHFPGIAALFDTSDAYEEFFMLDKSMQVIQQMNRSKSPGTEVLAVVKQAAETFEVRHPLSVTLTRGHGLIYFEPLVTGGETINDVSTLYYIAQKMCEKLSGKV